MINTVYKLKSPYRFEIAFDELMLSDKVIVRPTHLSICNADMRYFMGTRDAKILKEKLPLALIHEGIGKVVYDPSLKLQKGQTIVMVPNIPTETDPYIAENYLRSSKFSGSTTDGFLKEYVELEQRRAVILPEYINKDVAAFTEIVSVSMHAIKRFVKFSHERRETVGIWGDGNLAFITSLLLKKTLPGTGIFVFGIDRDKLSDFSFADRTFLTTDIPSSLKIDHAFECVGGNGSPIAIEQIIEYIKPEGTVSILGVSEYPVPINTRMMLEKGLRMFGTSRSGADDFASTIEMYKKHPEIPYYLTRLVGKTVEIDSFSDIKRAFLEDKNKSHGKTILHWNL